MEETDWKTRFESWLEANENRLINEYPGMIPNDYEFNEWCKEKFADETGEYIDD